VTGELSAERYDEEFKKNVLSCFEEAKSGGMSLKRFCEILQLNPRRLHRWLERDDLKDKKPGFAPGAAPHALTSKEKSVILDQAKNEQYADISHRILAYRSLDGDVIHASPSSFYRVMKDAGLTEHRGRHRGHRNNKPPVREELTGPLQRICWDISYIRTNVKYTYLYLYLILDEWSRKALQWAIEWELSKDVAKGLFSELFLREGIIDIPVIDRPSVINDRGGQMKAISVKQMFKDMEMDQRFSRPRTPNDNPFIESSFSTIKCHPTYPDRFLDRDEAIEYFEWYFKWYNTEHLHSGIGFVTPEQKHSLLADKIISERNEKLRLARETRLLINRSLKNPVFSRQERMEGVIL
jgi:transposase InsO family protein